ncbi:PREDICTED: protein O-linked-mannose beta-1,2-N-acetylglucosaminyltransferase 1-like isoform X2 [Diuraphis noxia]|uniref:protein O-linked-mannose beta-1,2-N-acetylglucosaminyltransferase 1-like isoform X2 n=1 Tax=Diuraphis noxia TaxID=143948 RepID=UPI00076355E7|nr:PREDICTED: protein O-linked-mannose beta-1,2-N-acetylglucosaminyltransferase 1-like isoform X2 [Diuraphis noxia]
MSDFSVRIYTKTMAAAAMRRNCCCWKRIRMLLVCFVILFVLVNVILTLFSANHQTVNSATSAAGIGYNSSSKWVQGDTAKYISIEVLSSKNRVKICVDDATVIDDSDPLNNRGMHVVVLNQHTGMVMAQRVFDTYMDDEPLIGFLHRVSSGRIMIFAVKDEASFHLTNEGRRAMQMHTGASGASSSKSGSGSAAGGSLWLSELGWRDMWAMVAKHHNNDPEGQRNGEGTGGHVYGESYNSNPSLVLQHNSKSVPAISSWGTDVLLRVQVPLDVNRSHNNQNDEWCDSWITAGASDDNNDDDGDFGDSGSIIDDDIVVESPLARRQRFCSRIEGYGDVCSCAHPAPLDFHPLPIPDSNIDRVPVVIVAGNRADYLYRTLKSVLNARGVQRHMVTVHVDGYYDEPVEVARLLGVRAVQHMPAIGDSVNGVSGGQISSNTNSRRRRVTQHYKSALTNTFGSLFPQADYAIVLEDDLDVSVDFFSFFSQTLPLLAVADDSTDGGSGSGSLYCVSAWNDQGYEHTASRPDVLYRIDWMPGLGWMLKKSLYKDQLESEWPTVEKPWDWDMWMRSTKVQRGRQCIVPEVSRTYHFGSSRSVNVNPYFQRTYFGRHAFYNPTAATNGASAGSHSGGAGGEYDDGGGLIRFKNIDKMTRITYLGWMERRIMTEGQLLDHTRWPCRKKQWNNEGSKHNDNRRVQNAKKRNYYQSDEEFFVIDEMMNNDNTIRSKKLFLLFIKMEDPSGGNRNTANVAWTPLAKCLGIWDLDIRGHYKGMWRLYLNTDNQDDGTNADEEGIPTHIKSGSELFIISCPFSHFCKFKPMNVTALWYNSIGIGEDDDGGDDML